MNAEEIAHTQTQARPGAKRKRRTLTQTAAMLDAGERDALDSLAEETGQSRSALIREAVRLRLKQRKGSEQKGGGR